MHTQTHTPRAHADTATDTQTHTDTHTQHETRIKVTGDVLLGRHEAAADGVTKHDVAVSEKNHFPYARRLGADGLICDAKGQRQADTHTDTQSQHTTEKYVPLSTDRK